jgi:hypothetical protein
MSATTENMKRNFIKPAVSALVGGFMLDQERFGSFDIRSTIPGLSYFNGTSLSKAQFGALIGFTSSFLVESVNNTIHEIDRGNRTKHFASFITHTAGGMFFWGLIPYLLSNDKSGSSVYNPVMAKIGFVSELGSQWIHENFVESGSFGQDVLDLL